MITQVLLSILFSALEIVMILGVIWMWQEIEDKCRDNYALKEKIAHAWLIFKIILVAIAFIFGITWANYMMFFE